jgi:2,3-bisphosphoglycerate-dependent phosphoglycerate mutase
MNNLILLRHGQSQWNFENRFTGWENVPLTEKGKEEARIAGKLMLKNHLDLDIVYSSVLKRANDTAEIAIKEMKLKHLWKNNKLKFIRNKSLNERDYGELVGLNKNETAKKYGKEKVQIWRRSYSVRPPGGESLKDVINRVKPYFEKYILTKINYTKNILIVAHGNSLRALLVCNKLYKPKEISSIELPTGKPFIITYDNGKINSSKFLD